MKEALAWFEYCKSLAPAIAEAAAAAPVAAGSEALIKALAKSVPDWHFHHALCRGGWYRLGGVVTGDGRNLADNLETWAEAVLDEHDGDLHALADDLAGQELYATRFEGRTHYLVASEGDAAGDFLQLEIEMLQEVRSHRLFAGTTPPASLEDLIDPRAGRVPPLPLAMPSYRFKRLLHVGAILKRMLAQRPDPAPIHRMLDDWDRSSAASASAFHNHWVVAVREHLDRYQQTLFSAQPIATRSGEPPEFTTPPDSSGVKLHGALSAYDREAGYPMAWFFSMLTGKSVPHWVAQTVVEDALAGFAYLPQRDIDVVRDWLHRPYAL